MNRKYYSALAASAAAVGLSVLTSTQASAQLKDPEQWSTSQHVPSVAAEWPDEGTGYPNYDPTFDVQPVPVATAATSPDDTTAELLLSGASALGGAAIALSAVWLHRRHQLRTT